MDTRNPNDNPLSKESRPSVETPEDVAVLYSWANLHGAKYRDFSASRREYRAQMRHRALEAQRESEERAARDAEARAKLASSAAHEAVHDKTAMNMDDAKRKEEEAAAAVEIARQHAIAAAEAAEAARLAEQEMLQAHAAARAETERYNDYRPLRTEEVELPDSDPYVQREHPADVQRLMHAPSPMGQLRPLHFDSIQQVELQAEQAAYDAAPKPPPAAETKIDPRHEVPEPVTMVLPSSRPDMRSEQPRIPAEGVKVEVEYPTYTPAAQAPPPGRLYYQPDVPTAFYAAQPHPYQAPDANEQRVVREQRMSQREVQREVQRNEPPAARPAWLYTDNDPVTAPRTPLPQNIPAPGPHVPSLLTDTLQHSRERVASRWFALKGVFEGQQPEQPEQPVRQKEARTPALVLFSLAGGVGKTSMVATLGRALASLGEKALLTDTTNYGLLPFYFGARELRPGVVRTFSPPSGSTDAPIYLVNYDTEQKLNDASQDWLVDEIARNSRGANRVILDLGTGSAALLRRLTRLNPTVLVPVSPDMNSVISIANVDKAFQGLTNADGRPIQPMYLLNQFDASLPLHLDVREVMRQQLGDRLLPFVIRRSPAVSEALAEGMTVIDYAPNSPVAEDYMNLAAWVRNVSAPAAAAFRGVRWSER